MKLFIPHLNSCGSTKSMDSFLKLMLINNLQLNNHSNTISYSQKQLYFLNKCSHHFGFNGVSTSLCRMVE
jgi:hypothetical protein